MSYLKALAKETFIYGGSSILARALQYILLTPYLTRKLVNFDYGRHAIYYALAAVLIILFTFRFETAFFRFGSKRGNLEKSFATASLFLLAVAIAFTIVLWVNAADIAAIFTRASDARFVKLFALIIAADALCALPFARLRLENRPIRFAVVKTISMLINILLVISLLEIWPLLSGIPQLQGLFQSSRILEYVFWANLGASAVTLVFLSGYYRHMPLTFDVKLWKRMFRYSLPLLVVGVAGTINLVFDSFFLTWFLPGSEEQNIATTGVYKACLRIAILMNLISQAYNYAAEPFFFKQIEAADAKQKYAMTAKAFAWVGSLAILTIALNLDWIKYLIDDSKWGALPLVPLMLLAYFFLGMYYNFAVWYKVTDRTRWGAWIALGGAAITISGNWLLIPVIETWGAVFSTLACFMLLATATYLIGKKYYPIPYNISRMSIYLLSAVFLFGIAQLIDQTHWHLALQLCLKWVLIVSYVFFWVHRENWWPSIWRSVQQIFPRFFSSHR